MKTNRIDLLKSILETGVYEVDINKGTIYNRNTGRYIGQKVNKESGLKVVTFTYADPKSGKAINYIYYTHLVIAYLGGLNVRKQIYFIDKDKSNVLLNNLIQSDQLNK